METLTQTAPFIVEQIFQRKGNGQKAVEARYILPASGDISLTQTLDKILLEACSHAYTTRPKITIITGDDSITNTRLSRGQLMALLMKDGVAINIADEMTKKLKADDQVSYLSVLVGNNLLLGIIRRDTKSNEEKMSLPYDLDFTIVNKGNLNLFKLTG